MLVPSLLPKTNKFSLNYSSNSKLLILVSLPQISPPMSLRRMMTLTTTLTLSMLLLTLELETIRLESVINLRLNSLLERLFLLLPPLLL
jgi:hypothetical protein